MNDEDKYLRDARFLDIGGLPTGFAPYPFKQLLIRQFTVAELQLLHHAMHSKDRPYFHIIRAVQLATSVDVSMLTDGDFEYLMAWLRQHSFPKVPLQVSWKCQQYLWAHEGDNHVGSPFMDAKTAKLKGYKRELCNHNNVEIITNVMPQVHVLEDDLQKLEFDDIDFPRVNTLSDFNDYIEENKWMLHMAEVARWIKTGKTFKAKLAFLNAQPDCELYERILAIREKYHHGISERMRLNCKMCDHTFMHESTPRLLSFFADNSETDIFNISYNLLSGFGMQPDMNMPAKIFLFHHSTMAKDRQEAEMRAKGIKTLG